MVLRLFLNAFTKCIHRTVHLFLSACIVFSEYAVATKYATYIIKYLIIQSYFERDTTCKICQLLCLWLSFKHVNESVRV